MADDDDILKIPSSRPMSLSQLEESMSLHYTKFINELNEDSKDIVNTTKDDLGKTALHYASQMADPEKVIKLLKYGACVNIVDKEGMTPFLYAVTKGYKRIVTPILENDVNIHSVHEPTGNTALHIAALNWNAILAETLIDKGVRINQPNNKGLTALHIAVNQLDLTMTELLLERGAKVNSLDKKGETALYKAVVVGDHRLVKMLINKGSFLNTQRRSTHAPTVGVAGPSSSRGAAPVLGKSPLHRAVYAGNVTVVDLLLSRSAWIDVRDDRGLTPLQCAVECGNNTIVMRLIDKGAAVVEISDWLVEKCRGELSTQVKNSVMSHLIKLGMVNMFSRQVSFENVKAFSELRCKCASELEKSKKYPLFKGVVFDVFHPSLRLALQNEIEQLKTVLDSPTMESEFPLYINVMRALVAQLKLRFLLISKGFLFFVILFKLNPSNRVPPKNVMLMIFKCLSNVDLQNMLVFCENIIAKEIK